MFHLSICPAAVFSVGVDPVKDKGSKKKKRKERNIGLIRHCAQSAKVR